MVTGASSGIGEQLARALAARGHRVALVARREDRLARLSEELGGANRAVAVRADLSVPADRDALAARLEELGVAEILVNSAGIGVHVAFIDAPRERELEELRLNVEAPVDLMRRYLPGMVDRGRGAVINVSSAGAFLPLPYSAGYGASKAYLLMHSEAVNEEVKRAGVSVTAGCPGPVRTDFHELHGADFTKRYPEAGCPPSGSQRMRLPQQIAGDGRSFQVTGYTSSSSEASGTSRAGARCRAPGASSRRPTARRANPSCARRRHAVREWLPLRSGPPTTFGGTSGARRARDGESGHW